MAEQYYVFFTAYGTSQTVPFEYRESAEGFALDMYRVGYEDARVFNEADPRFVEGDGSVGIRRPVYVPADDEPDADSDLPRFCWVDGLQRLFERTSEGYKDADYRGFELLSHFHKWTNRNDIEVVRDGDR